MISYLRGKLTHKTPTEIIIDVNGVGYHIHIPLSTFEKLEHVDGDVQILTYLHVREDTMQLYGFTTEVERELFGLLVSISGIGPRMAQGILSGLNADELREAIVAGNLGALTSISGVGRKTAERIILELRQKLGRSIIPEAADVPSTTQCKIHNEVVAALISLGFSRPSAERALKNVLRKTNINEFSVEELIKRALHHATT